MSLIRSIVSSWKSSIQLGGIVAAAGWGGGGTQGAGQAAERGSWRGGRALPGDSHHPCRLGTERGAWGHRAALHPCLCVWIACLGEPRWAGGRGSPSLAAGHLAAQGKRGQQANGTIEPCPLLGHPAIPPGHGSRAGFSCSQPAHGTVPAAGDVQLAAAGVLSPGGDCLPRGWLSRVPPHLSPALQPGQSQLQKLRSPASSAGSHCSPQSGLIEPLLPAPPSRSHNPAQAPSLPAGGELAPRGPQEEQHQPGRGEASWRPAASCRGERRGRR